MESCRNLALVQISGFACQMLAIDAMHAIDARSVEQYSAVKLFLDVQLLVGSFAGIILLRKIPRIC